MDSSSSSSFSSLFFFFFFFLFLPFTQSLGSNSLSYTSSSYYSSVSIPSYSAVSQTITVPTGALPFITIDWTVLVVLTTYVTYSKPQDLQMSLCDPAGYCLLVADYDAPSTCSNFFNGVMIYDNQTYEVGVNAHQASCPLSTLTADGNYYGMQGTSQVSFFFALTFILFFFIFYFELYFILHFILF